MPERPKGAKMLEKLREEGYTVEVSHERLWPTQDTSLGPPETPKPNGGTTVVLIFGDKEKTTLLASGEARCRSDERFDRKMGLAIAVGRAAKELYDTIPF